MKAMLGFGTARPTGSQASSYDDAEQERLDRVNREAQVEARRRVTALDLRVDVLTNRLAKHEGKQQH